MSSTGVASVGSLRGAIGGHSLHAQGNSDEIARRARAGFLAKFEREVDPDRVLPPEERRRRAEHARRAHMARLSLRAAQLRRKPDADAQELLALADELRAAAEATGGHDG